LTHKIQVGIPVAYNVCEVKLDKFNHWICVHREDFQLRSYIKMQVKSNNLKVTCTLIYHRNSVYTYPVVYYTKFYFTYIVSNRDSNLFFMSQFM